MNEHLFNGFLDELEKIALIGASLKSGFTGIGTFKTKAGKLIKKIEKPTEQFGKKIGKTRREFRAAIRGTT